MTLTEHPSAQYHPYAKRQAHSDSRKPDSPHPLPCLLPRSAHCEAAGCSASAHGHLSGDPAQTASRRREACRTYDSLTARGRAPPSGQCASHLFCCCHAALALLAPTSRPVPSVSGVPLPAAPLVLQSNPPSGHQPSRPQPMPTPLVPSVRRLSQSLAAVLLPWRRGRRPQVAVATENAQGHAAPRGRGGGA